MKNYVPLYEEFSLQRSIKKLKINSTFYHGSIINKNDEDQVNELRTGYMDWNAIWFTDDLNIAEEYSSEYHGLSLGEDDNMISIIYRFNVKSNKIADITYDLSQELIEFYGLYDFREAIDILEQNGFEGWKTTGSIGKLKYDDYAIFNSDLISNYEVMAYINNQWTDFMPLNDLNDLLYK